MFAVFGKEAYRAIELVMKIFISYRRAEDNKSYIVGTIHEKLAKVFGKEDVFRDTYNIASGADWRRVLKNEINSCKIMLVIIGPDWANLPGTNGEKRLFNPEDVTRWEVETGLKRSAEQKVVVIPVLVLGAEIPKIDDLPNELHPLLEKNATNIRNFPDFDQDMEKLIRDIRQSQGYREDDITIKYFEPKTLYIDEGPFWMGSPSGDGIPECEIPQHEVKIPAYRIGISPVTNDQYEMFIQETGTRVLPIMGWIGQSVRHGRGDFPVAGITFHEALQYCAWLSKKTGRYYGIPNEAQWEKACRAGKTSLYPWGDKIDPNRSNQAKTTLAAVTAYPAQNDYGLLDLVGNVRQWTISLWGENRVNPDVEFCYPWRNDGRNNPKASLQIHRVVRGSSFAEDTMKLRCATRSGQLPDDAGWLGAGIGFRVVLNF